MPSTRGFIAVLVASICALALAASSASAATVTNINDAGPGSLRQAVIDAAPGETITLPAGTYSLTSGEILVEKSLTIAGAGADSTVIRPGGQRAFLVLSAGNVTISGITFRETAIAAPSIQAGVLYSVESNLTLNGVVMTGNVFDATKAGAPAGAIQGGLILAVDGVLSIFDSKFVGNTFDANGAPGQKGGVVQAAILYVGENGSALTISGSSISNNTFDVRGGQGAPSAEQQGGVVQGGGLLATGGTNPVTIRSSSISANSFLATPGPGATKGGNVQGGALLVTDASAILTEDTIAANVGQTGGTMQGAGVLFSLSAPNTGTIVSSTIVGNSADGTGVVSGGGNLFLIGPIAIANSVVAGGGGPAGSQNCFFSPGEPPTTLGYNLDSLDQCGFHGGGDKVNTDPQLGPLGENGGLTPTMVPATTSPLVDQGSGFGLVADQRGVVRPIDLPSIPNAAGGNGSDIGAVELQPSNAFGFGKLKKNKKNGTAKLTVKLPVPNVGVLTLTGKGLKKRTVAVTGAKSSVTVVVATKGKAKKALRKKGKRKVAIKVTYTPTANAPLTKVRKNKLVKKLKK